MVHRTKVLHRLDKDPGMLRINIRCNAMPEVKYMARTLTKTIQNSLYFLTDPLWCTQ